MKRIFKVMLLFSALLTLNTINAQTLKEKMQAKVDAANKKLAGGGESEDTFNDSSFVSLDQLAAKWESGSYPSRTVDRHGKYESLGKIDLKVVKDDGGSVSEFILWSSTSMKKETRSGSDFVMSYGSLYIKENTIIKWRGSLSSNIFINLVIGDKVKVETAKSEIRAFLEFANKTAVTDNAVAAEKAKVEREKKEAARLKEFGLSDKQVTKIEIVEVVTPQKFGHYKPFSYEIEATLKDGKKIRTGGSKGYRSDYTITFKEGSITYAGLGKGVLKNDQIVVQVSLKSNPAIKTVKNIKIPYNENIAWKWNAYNGGYKESGSSANNFKIEIKQFKHTVTGAKLLAVRLTNVYSGKVIDEVKIGIDQTIFLRCSGGNGDVTDGKGYNGGNGGNITVIKDPNVEYYNLDYVNAGGNGGKGKYSIGSNGRDGTFKEETRAVKF